jgi:hypothetical protein
MIFSHSSLDFSTTHIYHADAIDYPRDTVAPRALDGARGRASGATARP